MPRQYCFSASVSFHISTFDSPPPPYQFDSRRKRSSGLELLQPRTLSGSPLENNKATLSSASSPLTPTDTSKCTSFSSLEIRNGSEQAALRQERYATQRATLKHTRSIPQIPPLEVNPASQEGREKKKRKSNKWYAGKIEVCLEGKGGRYGGELKIYDSDHLAVRHPLNALFRHSPSLQNIQKVHHSIFGGLHTLSFRLMNSEDQKEVASTSHSEPASQRSESTGLSGISIITQPLLRLTKRGRGKTISHTEPTSPHSETSSRDHQESTSATSLGSAGTTMDSGMSEIVVTLKFEDATVMAYWHVLLKSFAAQDAPRILRRLRLRVLDLQEAVLDETNTIREPAHGTQLGFSSFDIRSSKSSDVISSGKRGIKPEWSSREYLCVEIYLDKTMVGRTTWAKAEQDYGLPFWAEQFNFDDLSTFCECHLKICILRSNKSYTIATVPLSLVSDFSATKDERYPVLSLATGAMIGELRMVVSYQEIPILPRPEYVSTVWDGHVGSRMVYTLASSEYMEQLFDVIVKVGLVKDTVFPWFVEMVKVEAKSSGATLFRNNTPLTRTLEATMRLLCADFLRLSIGPTISTIAGRICMFREGLFQMYYVCCLPNYMKASRNITMSCFILSFSTAHWAGFDATSSFRSGARITSIRHPTNFDSRCQSSSRYGIFFRSRQ
ncbi:uncharacterized protein L203_101517 [Cryptococcus depauperatus CBS 7841]|uniref:C2 domain-containing protein n=1 Tax=Cryptococcus depauperatus CBS 7841 TaxID=1295531 RepID=A0AAJ8JQ47_9TREE